MTNVTNCPIGELFTLLNFAPKSKNFLLRNIFVSDHWFGVKLRFKIIFLYEVKLLYFPVCSYFISLFRFLLYCPVCSYFIALFVFLLYVPTFETSWSNFNENKSAKYYIPLFSKSFQKLQTMIEKMIHHCLEKVP